MPDEFSVKNIVDKMEKNRASFKEGDDIYFWTGNHQGRATKGKVLAFIELPGYSYEHVVIEVPTHIESLLYIRDPGNFMSVSKKDFSWRTAEEVARPEPKTDGNQMAERFAKALVQVALASKNMTKKQLQKIAMKALNWHDVENKDGT